MTISEAKKHHDIEGDILYIEFESERSAKGIQLTENIVLRVDPESGEVLGLAIHNFAQIAAQNLSDPLTGLPASNMTLREPLLRALNSKPLKDFLVLHYDALSLGPALLPHVTKAA